MLAKAGQEKRMTTVNMLAAKTSLSRLVEAVESGAETEIIIARNGKPAARLVPLETPKNRVKIGHADGRYVIGEPDPQLDAEVAALFGIHD